MRAGVSVTEVEGQRVQVWAVGDSLFAGSWVVDLREPAGDTLVDADGLRGHTHPAVLINFPDGVGGSLIQGSEGPTFECGALEGTAPRLVHQSYATTVSLPAKRSATACQAFA